MNSDQIQNLVAARRWLDSRHRTAAESDAAEPGWRDHAVVLDAQQIGVALLRQWRQLEARTWLGAAAQVAPPRMLAVIGGSLVDAAALPEAEAALRRGAAAGDTESSLHLGRFLLFDGRDEEAARWLRSAMGADLLTARHLLSDLRSRGADDVADRWAAVAAELGDGSAAVDLAWSAARRGDDADAGRWFGWAEQLGHEDLSMERLAVAVERGDGPASRRWLVAAADEGHSGAQLGLGLELLAEGDETAGWALLRQAAEGGEVRAQLQLAARAGFRGERDELVHWMLEAASADPAEASALAETLLSAGQSDLAEELLRACVAGGHDLSRVPLGRLLVARGALAEAVDVVQPAADAGLPEGGVLLGLAEEKLGRLDQARLAYLRASQAGDGRAANKLGMLSSAAGDDPGARRWFVEGARAGEASSMFNLASMEPSPERSQRWMVLAAAHGHPHAALRVGAREVEAGRPAEGVRWLRQAVELGEPQAAEVLSALIAQAPSLRGVGLSGSAGR